MSVVKAMSRPLVCPSSAQRGTGSLPVLLLMLLGLLLYLLHSQQALIGQTRHVSRTVQGAVALEAAEAGLAWTLAVLNQPGGLSTDRPADTPESNPTPLRERLLAWSPDSAGRVQPIHGTSAVACTGDPTAPGRWACQWATDAHTGAVPPQPNEPDPDAADAAAALPASARPAWVMQLQAGPLAETDGARRTTLTLAVTGCSHASLACGAAPDAPLDPDLAPDARRHLRLTLALLGDGVTLPDAALSAGGQARIGPGSRVILGEPGAAAIAIEAAGRIDLSPGARAFGAPGRPDADALRANQPALIDPSNRWWRHFRASAELMRRLPSLRHLDCPAAGCNAGDLEAALADGARSLWLTGALNLDGGTWGHAERPLLLVVDGPVRLNGPVRFDGWLLADALVWQSDAAAGPSRGLWQGAISTWGDAELNGPVDLVHRPALLARLRGAVGTWTALPGSWRDHGP